MIKHIVMWKLKEYAEGADKKQNALKMKELLMGLNDKIDSIVHIEVGININRSEAAYDVVLYSEFSDSEGLNTYQKHEEHLKVAAFIKAVVQDRVVVDYEI
jgi:hypothetical protein